MCSPADSTAHDGPGRLRGSSLEIGSYDVAVDLTGGPETFWSRTQVRFRTRAAGTAAFADVHAASIRRGTLNGTDLDVAASWADGRLELPRLAEENTLTLEAEFAYASAGLGLHDVTDLADGRPCVHSRCYPEGAPHVYGCFDEPDLRSPVTLSVQAPAGWTCLANALVLSQPQDGDPGRWRFAPTAPIPPRLFALAAGPFTGSALQCARDREEPLPVTVQAMPSAVALLDPEKIVDLLGRSLRCYERYFGVRYPYRKCDLVFVPGLAELAYSVPGLIVIDDQVLKDPAARADRYLAAVLAHELAHEWFGGVVIMRRGVERSLDEALTTYVSRIALAEILPGTDPWEARTSESLPDYAYTRDAVACRELEALIGRQAVIAGLGDLLRRHAHGSPSRDDLVQCWTRASGRELSEWAARTLVPAGADES